MWLPGWRFSLSPAFSETRVFFVFGRTLKYWFICKVSIKRNFCRGKCAWLVYMIYLTYFLLSVFLSSQWSQHLTLLLEFSKSNVLIVLLSGTPFLNQIGSLNCSWIGVQSCLWKSWSDAYQKIIFCNNVTILFRSLTNFDFVSICTHRKSTLGKTKCQKII